MARAYPRSNQLYWVKDNVIAADFPDISKALKEPDGLLAIGGDLAPERLLDAYMHGIFPWNNDIQPVLWWSPDPRWVLFPGNLRISRSLKKPSINRYTRSHSTRIFLP
jgi:leucyl/phenylalanyl-tRNA--protein transferase